VRIRAKRGKIIGAGILLILFGALRLPVEDLLEEEWRERRLLPERLELGMREGLGQMSFVGALGGFRSLVASMLSLEAYTAWENVDWGKLESTYDLITALQPGVVAYWEEYGWHLAYNAHSYYLYDEEVRLALREYLAATYLEKGKAVLRDGIRHNPGEVVLYVRLGMVLRTKGKDHCAAAEVFGQAARLEDAPEYVRRFVAYELFECPGREREAYDQLAALYREGPQHRKPTLLTKLAALEEQLDIPVAQRLLTKGAP